MMIVDLSLYLFLECTKSKEGIAVLIYILWSKGIDPDNAAIPYLTSLGDLLGGVLLAWAVYTESILI